MLGLRRFSRYVLHELSTPTLLGLLLYTFVLLMNHIFVVAEKALAKDLGFDLTARLLLNGIPNLLVLSIPMSVILGSLIGVGRLSADNEWVALQGSGGGPSRLLRPILIHGLIWSLMGFVVYGYVAPRSNYALRNLRGELLFASNLAADLKPRVFYTDLPDAVLFVDEIKAGSKGRLEGILLVKTDPQTESTRLIMAAEGDLYPAPDRSGDLLLELYDGVAYEYQVEAPDQVYFAPRFKEARDRFEARAYLKGLLEPPVKVVQDFTPPELWAEFVEARQKLRDLDAAAAAAAESGKGSGVSESKRFLADNRYRRIVIEMNQRVALPLASLFFAVLALPLGITRVRSGKGAGFALSLLVILIYWSAFTFARDQAVLGKFPAILGPWAGNLVILPWALWGLWRMSRAPSSWRGLVPSLFGLIGAATRMVRRAPILRRRPAANGNNQDEQRDPVAATLEELGGTSSRFVARLDSYVAAHYLRIVLFAMSSAYLVYILVESKTLMDGLLRTEQPFSLLLRYYPYFAPGVLYIVLPISCLIGAVVTFTLLTRSGELIAIKSSGISMRRITLSVVLLTAAMSGVLYLVQDRIAPGTNQKANEIRDQIMGRAPRTHGMPAMGRWGFGPQGLRLYHYRLFDPDSGELQGVNIFTVDRDGPRILDHRFTERARWNGTEWELQHGWYRTLPANGSAEELLFERFEEQTLVPLDSPDELVNKQRGIGGSDNLSQQMSASELQTQIQTLEKSGYDTTRLRVAFHGKVAHSLTPLVMVLLGLPFAFKVGRRGSLYGIGVALLLVLVYWAVLAIFNALGLETLLDPRVAAWAPNVLFGLFGIYLMLYIKT